MEIENSAPESPFADDNYVRASGTKRFLNYLIDIILFYILVFFFAILIGIFSPSTLSGINDKSGSELMLRIFFIFFYAVYMSATEAILNGKSLGKLITQTRAVNLDGSQISASTAISRGFSRAVPFCALSALGTPCLPWQDKWTDTMVIDEKKTAELKNY